MLFVMYNSITHFLPRVYTFMDVITDKSSFIETNCTKLKNFDYHNYYMGSA